MVVINVIEYKNADAYDHLWVRIGVCTPAVFCIFVDRTARNRVSCKREKIYEISIVNLRQTNESYWIVCFYGQIMVVCLAQKVRHTSNIICENRTDSKCEHSFAIVVRVYLPIQYSQVYEGNVINHHLRLRTSIYRTIYSCTDYFFFSHPAYIQFDA